MIKKYGIYVILLCGWILFLTLWVNEKNENEHYRGYLSKVIAEKMGLITTVPSYNLGILEEIQDNHSITKEQANELSLSLIKLDREIQDISNFAVEIGMLETEVHHIRQVVRKYNNLLLNLTSTLDNNLEFSLSSEQLSEFAEFKRLMELFYQTNMNHLYFTSAIGEDSPTLGFINYYSNISIDNDYWVFILKKYEEISSKNNY